jgi:hypothetical protein
VRRKSISSITIAHWRRCRDGIQRTKCRNTSKMVLLTLSGRYSLCCSFSVFFVTLGLCYGSIPSAALEPTQSGKDPVPYTNETYCWREVEASRIDVLLLGETSGEPFHPPSGRDYSISKSLCLTTPMSVHAFILIDRQNRLRLRGRRILQDRAPKI